MIRLHSFAPFEPALRGLIRIHGGELLLRYELDDPSGLVLDSFQPGRSARFERADGLWKTTCFEAFFAIPGDPGYWELNLAGDGIHWNLYRFDDYRSPSPPKESQDFELARMAVTPQALDCALRSNRAWPERLEASLTAVLRASEATHYFATTHAGEKPDFHLRGSFTISLP